MRSILAWPFILAFLMLRSTSLPAADSPEGIEFFEKKIRPVLVAKCYSCLEREAGGGVKAGFRYGKTDEYGREAIEGRVHIHNLHAAMLHLLGATTKNLPSGTTAVTSG